jgi:hypothetical protein
MGWSYFSRFVYFETALSVVLVASLVSWLGTAIPLILRGNITVWSALKKSVELSGGYEGALFLLVIETVAGSVLGAYATFYGLRLLFPDYLRHTLWYGWGLSAIAVLASAALEPPLFIGLSLLADPERLNVASLPIPEQAAHIH